MNVQCVPALDMKMLLRCVPRPPALAYVLLAYVVEIPGNGNTIADLFSRVLFFAPVAGHPSSSPFLGTFSPCLPSTKALFCRTGEHNPELGEGQSQDGLIHKDFGKEIPSRTLWSEKRSDWGQKDCQANLKGRKRPPPPRFQPY